MEITLYDNPGDNITLNKVTPEYSINDLKTNPEPLYRINDRGMRFYYTLDNALNPTFYGSTTTIKSQVTPTPRAIIEKELQMGKQAFETYRNMRASFGTFWHVQAAVYTENQEYDLDSLQPTIQGWGENKGVATDGWHTDAWKGLLAWTRFMNDYNVQPIAIEIPLAHPGGFAGTIDLVCQMNAKKYTDKTAPEDRKRITAIIDWKTGYIFPDHAIQLHLNKKVWEHHFPGHPIDKVFNWTWRDWRSKPSYELRNQTSSEEAELIKHYLHIWKKKFFSKPRDIRAANGLIEIGQDSNQYWEKMPIEEYVKRKHQELEGSPQD